MHAHSPEDAIQRLIDVFPSAAQPLMRRRLATVLRAVMVQHLLFKASGKGRAAAFGVLIPDGETRRMIAEGRELTKRKGKAAANSCTLAESICALRDAGTATAEEAEKALAAIEA